tara:strand:- start:160 stop:441 length:282 start_codon:yes stop_codon:yes gene_type:complete
MSKTKTELSKMTKKNLLLHIEKMQLMIENDHLQTQKETKEIRKALSKMSDTTKADIRRAAGIMRYQVSDHNFVSTEDKKKMIKIVDTFIDTVV